MFKGLFKKKKPVKSESSYQFELMEMRKRITMLVVGCGHIGETMGKGIRRIWLCSCSC